MAEIVRRCGSLKKGKWMMDHVVCLEVWRFGGGVKYTVPPLRGRIPVSWNTRLGNAVDAGGGGKGEFIEVCECESIRRI